MFNFEITLLGDVDVKEIPPQKRVSGTGPRGPGVFKPLVDALEKLPRGRAMKIKTNAPAAQYLHGRVAHYFKGAGLTVPRVKVRGDISYIYYQ